MKTSVFALAAIFTVIIASTAIAGQDELQMQIIRKAMEAKQAARKNEQGRTAIMTAPRPWWHPKLGSAAVSL